jgi:hypothetical protein
MIGTPLSSNLYPEVISNDLLDGGFGDGGSCETELGRERRPVT